MCVCARAPMHTCIKFYIVLSPELFPVSTSTVKILSSSNTIKISHDSLLQPHPPLSYLHPQLLETPILPSISNNVVTSKIGIGFFHQTNMGGFI